MVTGNGNRNGGRNETFRLCLLALGLLLIALAPIIGALPGPGGVLLLLPGLALTLRNSNWAKRLYVRFKQRWPHYGRWTDWGLRRKSHIRRLRRKEHKQEADD